MSTSEKPGDSSARGHLTEEGPPPRTGEGFPAGGGSYQDLDDGEKTVPLAYVVEWRDSKHSGTYAIDSADDLRRRIRPAPGKSAGDRKLVIVRGLPDTLLDILQDELHVDREFIQAHVARRRYRPPVWMCPAQYAQYEYPELVTRRDATQQDVARRSHQGRDVRGARESVVHPDIRTFSTDGEAVVYSAKPPTGKLEELRVY